MEHAQIADYLLRDARPDDQAQIYHLKAQSVRPYVEKIWGWDEVYQQQDFARDFQAIEHFQVIEVGGNFAGFIQTSFSDPYYEIQELHLLPAGTVRFPEEPVERFQAALFVRRSNTYL